MSNALSASTPKQAARALIDRLPETASWDELAQAMELHASIERGLADSDAGRVIAVDDLMKEMGITE